MARNTFDQWMTPDTPLGQPFYFGPEPSFHGNMDEYRSMYRRTPDAQYPDGYLGTIINRRENRFINTGRGTQRSYQRGVHKGERIDQRDYLWPPWLQPTTGIANQLAGLNPHPPPPAADMTPVVLTNEGKAGPRGVPRGYSGSPGAAPINPARAAALGRLAPSWGW